MILDAKKYCQCMEEVRHRASLIGSFIASGGSFGSNLHDYEVVCLHLRKILELIAFSALTANKEEYSKIHNDYSKKWNAKRLLKSIGKLNPDFYPQPVEYAGIIDGGVKHFKEVETGFLNKEDWIKLYDLCSKALHVWNPYEERDRQINFEISVAEWVKRIQNLLKVRYARPLGGKVLWLVNMVSPEDGKAHVMLSSSVENIE